MGQENDVQQDRIGLISRNKSYDLKTGEVKKGALVWVPEKPKSQFGRSWFQMAQDTLKKINENRKVLGLEGVTVFNALMYRLDFENYIQVQQSEIASELDMKASNVSRAIARLESLGFIKRGPKVGRSSTYQLHPELAWKGKPGKHFTARETAKANGWRVIENDQPSLFPE